MNTEKMLYLCNIIFFIPLLIANFFVHGIVGDVEFVQCVIEGYKENFKK